MAAKKSDWEEALIDMGYNQFKSVRLIADGYNVSFSVFLSKNKLVICWFIDGTWKGDYMRTDSEVGAKFGKPMRYRFPKKNYDLVKRIHGKKAADKAKQEFESKIHGYLNYFPSAQSIICHLKKTCTTIKLNTKTD